MGEIYQTSFFLQTISSSIFTLNSNNNLYLSRISFFFLRLSSSFCFLCSSDHLEWRGIQFIPGEYQITFESQNFSLKEKLLTAWFFYGWGVGGLPPTPLKKKNSLVGFRLTFTFRD